MDDDFYQVMVGSQDMDLHGWRQLAEWSIEHASMESERERQELKALWQQKWDVFVTRLNEALGGLERLERRKGEDDEAFGVRVAEYEARMEAFLAAF